MSTQENAMCLLFHPLLPVSLQQWMPRRASGMQHSVTCGRRRLSVCTRWCCYGCVRSLVSVHMAAGVVADMDQIATANPSKDSPGDYIIIKLYRVPLRISRQWNRSGRSLLFCWPFCIACFYHGTRGAIQVLHNAFFWEIWPPQISVTNVHAATLLRYSDRGWGCPSLCYTWVAPNG